MATIGLMGPDPYCKSGYGIFIGEMAKRLKAEGYDVVILGNQHASAPVNWNGITVTPYLKEGFLEDCLEYWVKRFNIGLLVSFWNFWAVSYLAKIKASLGTPYVIITAVEGKLNPYSINLAQHTLLREASAIAGMCPFAAEQISNLGYKDAKVVMPGISDEYKILPRDETRKEKNIPLDTFFAGFVGRNFTERKLIPYILIAWKRLMERIPKEEQEKCTLYLHSETVYGARSYDIPAMIRYFGLQDTVMTPSKVVSIDPIDDAEMCKVYNLMDVALSPSMGESPNMTILECFKCGVPVIAHDFAGQHDLLVESGALAIPSKLPYFPQFAGLFQEMQLPDLDLFSEGLYAYYKEWKENKGYMVQVGAIESMKAKDYTWDNSYKQFMELVKPAIDTANAAPELPKTGTNINMGGADK